MKDKFNQLCGRLRDRPIVTMKLPLFVYFACLPLFFSASAMSWPFPESAQIAPPQGRDWPKRDCLTATSGTETQDAQEAVEDEEPECD